MDGELPPKLSAITFSGKGVKVLSASVLGGVRSPSLTCIFKNTSMVKLTSTLFRNAGRAKNISLDVGHSFDLQHVQNPSIGDSPGLHRKTFLMELRIAENKLNCDCDIG